ncbi:MAG: hypothetical protein JWQ57_116 [Mucilaginibacter sp.]|nr:hypothetical protein [Mucilaginibacter sp.]
MKIFDLLSEVYRLGPLSYKVLCSLYGSKSFSYVALVILKGYSLKTKVLVD